MNGVHQRQPDPKIPGAHSGIQSEGKYVQDLCHINVPFLFIFGNFVLRPLLVTFNQRFELQSFSYKVDFTLTSHNCRPGAIGLAAPSPEA